MAFRLLTGQPLDAPLGFTLLGSSYESRDQDFARSPLARFADPTASRRTRWRLRVSLGFRWHSPKRCAETQRQGEATLLGFSHPSKSQAFERAALRAMCSPRAASSIAADPSALLRWVTSLYRSCLGSAKVPSIRAAVDSVSLPRPFQHPLSRCPGSSISQKALPIAGSLIRQRRPAIGFYRSALAS
jgi:hypothetical protein